MATAQDASELKQQGALEAAQDPNSSVTAEQAENAVLHEAHKGGSAAFKFDPDATPAEKAAQARAVRYTNTPMRRGTLVLTWNRKSQRASAESAIPMPQCLPRML